MIQHGWTLKTPCLVKAALILEYIQKPLVIYGLYEHSPWDWIWAVGYHLCAQSIDSVGFLSLGTTEISGWLIVCCRDYRVHCRIFSSTLGLYPLMPVVPAQLWQLKMSPDIAIYSQEDKTTPHPTPLPNTNSAKDLMTTTTSRPT